jgi:DNA-binding transcriptional regulator YhcF (GntR family)
MADQPGTVTDQPETANTDDSAVGVEAFGLSIDRDAEVPIGVQLAWALRAHIQAGRLRAGQRLPGLREVAEATGVNVNTVRSVYQRLDREGLIDSQQGSGTFVAPRQSGSSDAATIAASAAQEARDSGADPREVAAALFVSPMPAGETLDASASQRRLLRRQIAALEQTLGEIEASHPGLAPAPEGARRPAGPALLSAAELEDVRTRLVRRLGAVQAAIDEQARGAPGRSAPASLAPASAKAKAAAPETKTTGKRRKRTSARAIPAGT